MFCDSSTVPVRPATNLRFVMLGCALLVAVDTAIELASSPAPNWYTPVAEAVLFTFLLLSIARPTIGNLLLGISWCIVFPLPVNLSMSLSLIITLPLVVLSYHRMSWGISLMIATIMSRLIQLDCHGAFPKQITGPSILMMLPWIAMPAVIPVMLGLLLKRWHVLQQYEVWAKQHAASMNIAARLHDSTTNELSYLIMNIDHLLTEPNLETSTAESLRQMRATAQRALGQSHDIIAILRDDISEDNDQTVHDAPTSEHQNDSIQRRIADLQQDTASLGITGETIVTDPHGLLDRLDASTRELMHALIRETFANIAKHADPAAGYVITIAADTDGIYLSCADVSRKTSGSDASEAARNAGHQALGMGFGLQHLRTTIKERGGRFAVHEDEGHWSCMVFMPTP